MKTQCDACGQNFNPLKHQYIYDLCSTCKLEAHAHKKTGRYLVYFKIQDSVLKNTHQVLDYSQCEDHEIKIVE